MRTFARARAGSRAVHGRPAAQFLALPLPVLELHRRSRRVPKSLTMAYEGWCGPGTTLRGRMEVLYKVDPFGVQLDAVTMDETVARVANLLAEGDPAQHCVINSSKVVLMADDPKVARRRLLGPRERRRPGRRVGCATPRTAARRTLGRCRPLPEPAGPGRGTRVQRVLPRRNPGRHRRSGAPAPSQAFAPRRRWRSRRLLRRDRGGSTVRRDRPPPPPAPLCRHPQPA